METKSIQATPVTFIDFHGMKLLVVENVGKQYVEVKPLGDMLGMKWRTLRETVLEADNAIRYGTKRLLPAEFNRMPDTTIRVEAVSPLSTGSLGPPRGPLGADLDGIGEPDQTEIRPEIGVLHILFERVQMFLARVNTSQMRVNGNESGANYLLALHIEWAQVLHKYDMGQSVAVKAQRDGVAELEKLAKLRTLMVTTAEKDAASVLIREAYANLGCLLADDPKQPSLI